MIEKIALVDPSGRALRAPRQTPEPRLRPDPHRELAAKLDRLGRPRRVEVELTAHNRPRVRYVGKDAPTSRRERRFRMKRGRAAVWKDVRAEHPGPRRILRNAFRQGAISARKKLNQAASARP